MRLRIRHPPDNPILDLPDHRTFGFLREQISRVFGMPSETLTIKVGFPPLEVLAGDSLSLTEANLKDGDLITVQKSSSLGKQAVSSAPPPKKFLAESGTTTGVRQSSTPTSRKGKSSSSRHMKDAVDERIKTLSSDQSESPSAKRKRRGVNLGTSEEDWGINLVEVFSKSGGLTAAQRMLKGAFKSAVRRRAESTLAEQRWAAVQGQSYKLYEPPIGSVKFKVTFPIGPRSARTEEYPAFPAVLLGAVIREVYSAGLDEATGVDARNNLRPVYLAEIQPLVFWNIVRLYNGEVKKGLDELCPDIDWDFIDDRERLLSEKARMNKEQAEETQARKEISQTQKKQKTGLNGKSEMEEK